MSIQFENKKIQHHTQKKKYHQIGSRRRRRRKKKTTRMIGREDQHLFNPRIMLLNGH